MEKASQKRPQRILQSCHLTFSYIITYVPHVWLLTIISFMILMSRLASGLVQIIIRPKSFNLLVHSRESSKN